MNDQTAQTDTVTLVANHCAALHIGYGGRLGEAACGAQADSAGWEHQYKAAPAMLKYFRVCTECVEIDREWSSI